VRSTFRATIATTIVASLGACSSVKHSSDDLLSGAPTDESTLTSEAVAPEDTTASLPTESTESASTGDEANLDATRTTTRPRSGTPRPSVVPVVAATPFQVDNFWMNAFYFVRNGDSWEKISQKLYSRPDRAGLLKNWNPQTKLVAGSIVYYNSPTRPEDSESMKIFSEDFGHPLEQVKVKTGDSLSSLALARFGSPVSWKEIAAINPQLSNPDQLEVGQVLNIQPSQIDSSKVVNDLVAQAPEAASSTTAQVDEAELGNSDIEINVPPQAPRAEKQVNAPPTLTPTPTPVATVKALRLDDGGVYVKQLGTFLSRIPDDMLYGAIGLVALALLAISILRRKRKVRPESISSFDTQPRA
jgi:LysM repeat protein